MKRMRYALQLSPLAISLASSCAVYVPTVPSTPFIEAGQVELTASLRSLNSLEAGAAWSPRPHLLLTTEAALQLNPKTRTVNSVTATYHDTHQQVGFGVGTYRAPTARLPLYLAAVGGVGFASMDLHSLDVGLLFILPVPVQGAYYQATYRRYYGQLYAAYPTANVVLGCSVRATTVEYTRLLADGQPFEPAARFFWSRHFLRAPGPAWCRGRSRSAFQPRPATGPTTCVPNARPPCRRSSGRASSSGPTCCGTGGSSSGVGFFPHGLYPKK